jgi:hypothetical protein
LPVPPTPKAAVVAAKPVEPAKPVEVAAVKPVEPAATKPAESAAVAEVTTPAVVKPVPKPAKLAATSLEPGTWVMVENQLVPIPKQKPKR